MPWILRGIKTAAAALRAGVSNLSHWLFPTVGSASAALASLWQRLPDMLNREMSNLFDRFVRSVQAGREMSRTGNEPDYRSVPSDPSFAREGRYRYDVNYSAFGLVNADANARPGKIADRFTQIYSDRPMTYADIEREVRDQFNDQLRRDTIEGGFGGDTIVTDLNFTIVAIWRST